MNEKIKISCIGDMFSSIYCSKFEHLILKRFNALAYREIKEKYNMRI